MKKSLKQLRCEVIDLGSRLSLCSNTGEGRKVRHEIEKIIVKNEAEILVQEALHSVRLKG